MMTHFMGRDKRDAILTITIDEIEIKKIDAFLKPYREQGFKFKQISSLRWYFRNVWRALINK